jgi:glycogen operon protein
MIVMGDEVRRTQFGNNNCYCLDNEISWFDWTLTTRQAEVFRFLKLLIARRRLRDLYPEHQQPVSLNQLLGKAKTAWHGVKLGQPDWSPWSHSLAFGAHLPKEKLMFHMILNAYWEPLEFELPPLGSLGGGPWRRWIDTALDSPHDIVEWKEAQSISLQSYRAGPRSVAVLWADV